jgi:predicted negative regulator of RcsB-dependent stress response
MKNNIDLLGVGGMVIGGGYGSWRLWSSRQATTSTTNKIESTQASSSEQAGSGGDESTESERSAIESLREQADTALDSAETARKRDDFSAARDGYEEAIKMYRTVVYELSAGQSDMRTELEAAIESTCQDLNEVTNLDKAHRAIVETLQQAERSLQEAIVAYVENDQTVARIRFRQARDGFNDAHETIAESETDLLTEPVTVDVQPDRELSSTTIADLPEVTETAAAELTEVGIVTIENLDNSNEPPWTPTAVEELVADGTIDEMVATGLTLLSWWHGDGSYTFETAETVECRQHQADYGFTRT